MQPILRDPRRRIAVVAAVLTVFTAALVIAAAHRGQPLSPYDEATHADYAYRVANFDLPARGSLIAPAIRLEWSCRAARPSSVPPCDAGAHASAYPLRGENYNFGHPPIYYTVVGWSTRAIDVVVPGANFVLIGRLLGLGWLLAGMAVLFVALRRFDVPRGYAAAAVALLPLCPGVLHASSTVTSDAGAVLAGAGALFVLSRILVAGRAHWLVPASVTALATATKVISGLPMLAVACVAMIMAVARRRRGETHGARELATTAAAIVIVFVVVYEGWSAFQGLRGQENWVSPIAGLTDRVIVGAPFDELLSTSFTGLQLITSYSLQPQLNGMSVTLWARLLGALVAAAPLLAMLLFVPQSPRWVVGSVTLGGLLAFPLVAEVQVYVQNDQYLPGVVGRYGMSFVPWALACLAMVAAQRRLLGTTLAVTGTGAVVMLFAISGVYAIAPP
jgi:uncharacterized membrane protein YccF (DUF307 family)